MDKVVSFMYVTSSMHKNAIIHGRRSQKNTESDLKRQEEFTHIYKNLADYCLIFTRN